MKPLIIEPGDSTPQICLDPKARRLEFAGDCYPENAHAFFAPVNGWIVDYLRQPPGDVTRLDFRLAYFNSACLKWILLLFAQLEEAAERGFLLEIYWYYDEQNPLSEDQGLSLAEDFSALPISLCPILD